MSSKIVNQYKPYNYRTTYYNSKTKPAKKKKCFNYPKSKTYSEEMEIDSTPYGKENQSENANKNTETGAEITYEDEYQGLIIQPIYADISNGSNIYYFIEQERIDDYNNFKLKWKTEICRYWEMYGECKYGDNCAFAHGDSELKQRKITFNYKTKPCKQFFELGYCSYGSRCQFSHKKEEDLKNPKNNVKEKKEEVSYLKIIEELLSEDNQISHELVKRPRLMTFENITHCTLEESENSKLKLYEDIINLKNDKSKKNDNNSLKQSEDTNCNSNSSSDCGNDKEE
jgi:hypothetical protein